MSSFQEKIKLASSDKFYMVQIQGAKLLNFVTSIDNTYTFGGIPWTTWTCTIQKYLKISSLQLSGYLSAGLINSATVNTTGIFPTAGDGSASNNTYYYNPSTGQLKFFSKEISPVFGSTEFAMVEYKIFFTNFVGKYAPSEMSSGGVVYWQPRLPKGIDLGFSQANNMTGNLSTSVASIQLKNQDQYFNDFFSEFDSFNNRQVKCWRCIDGIDNYQFEFLGAVRAASLDDNVCVFDVADITVTFDNTYYGDAGNRWNYYSELENGGTYSIKPDQQAIPITRMFGKISPYGTYLFNTGQTLPVRLLDPKGMIKSVCNSYDAINKTTSTNRKWSCGFGSANVTTKTANVVGVSHYVSGSFSASNLGIDVDPSTFLCVGDTFINNGQYGIITGVIAGFGYIQVWPYNAAFAAGLLTRHKVSSVVITSGTTKYYALPSRDYNCVIGPNGDMQVVFTNNFEANFAGLTTLDPDNYDVFIRMWNDDYDAKASSIMKQILTDAGLPVSHAFSPDQVPTWPDPQLSFCVPDVGQTSFPIFRDSIEKSLKSALSFIYVDSIGEFRYKSFLDGIYSDANIENASGQDHNDAITQSNSNQFSVTFDLFDQFVGVKFNPLTSPGSQNFYFDQPDYWWYGGDKIRTKFYNSNKYLLTDTIVDTNGPGIGLFFGAYTMLMTSRKAFYNLNVFSRHFLLYVGDDILVSRKKLIGNSNQYYMRVISISKRSNESTLQLLDLKTLNLSLS